ncbi:choice-of-anchor D domain-containing protein [uncultured Sphingomonas sp.]|uniref:choice-of-anchor D domain-containing protein n=1 Tax=uncultured Sphingomonas sp. TaxID=158754 RepID=UPI0035CA3D9E
MRYLSSVRSLALASTAFSLIAATVATPAAAAVCTWNGGAGDWGSAGGWDCGVPGAGDDARIDGGKGISSVVSVTDDRTISTIVLDSGDRINIAGGTLRIGGGSFTNNGAVTIGNGSTLLVQSTALAITGTGTITLTDTGGGATFYSQNGVQMTIGGGQSVVGAGNIGANQGVITNNGTITANGTGTGLLTLDAQGGNGGIGAGNGVGGNTNAAFYNTGLLQAIGGAILTFAQGFYENSASGSIQASGGGSTVHLNDDVRIANGSLSSSGGGKIEATSGNQYLQGVTLTGGSALNITNDTVHLDGALTNNGTITIGTGGIVQGEASSVAIGGAGTIRLADGSATLYNSNGTAMTIGSGQTVVGTGNIGANQGVLTNNGTINATGLLTLDAQGGNGGIGSANGVGTNTSSAFLNTGLIEATGGATLTFAQGLYENSGAGSIQALGGSTIHLNDDVRILNGPLTASAGSMFEANSGNQYLQDVALTNGTTFNVTNDTLHIDGTLTNNGTVTLGAGGTLLGETTTSAIAGTGTIALASTAAGTATLYNYNGTAMTIGSGQTVVGSGNVGINQGVVTNNGTINANGSGTGLLTLDAQGGNGGIGTGNGVGTNTNTAFLNTGLIEATGGATLTFAQGLYENSGAGSIQALGGSTIHLNDDVRILNGPLTASAGSMFEANSGNQYLQDVALTNGTTFNVTNDTLHIDGTLTNNGTVTLGAGGTLLGETTTSAIAGTGTIALASTAAGTATLYNYNGTAMTIGSGQTVVGSGNVGINQGVVTNNGTINANGSGTGLLTLDAQGGNGGIGTGNGVGTNTNTAFLNTGLIEATGGATLTFAQGLYENSGAGSIQALGGSTIHLDNDVRILNGPLTSDAGSKFEANSGNQYLQNVTLTNGTTFNVTNDNLRIDNMLTNNGTITLGANATLLGETTTSTLGGNGTVVLADAGATFYNYNGTTMTIGSGQIVRGTGSIGANQGVIENDGNILADGAITIDAQGGSGGIGAGNGLGTGGNVAFLNNGQVQANNGGATLTLAQGSYENTALGAFSAGTGSTFEMANDASLVNLESGGVLDKGFYGSFTTGAASTLDLRSNATNSIVTIGTNHAGSDTTVFLSGANSVLEVTPLSGGTPTTIDSSLQQVAQSGVLVLANGRTFTASNGAFSNAGEIRLQDGTFSAPAGLTNSGLIDGHGTVGTPITNSGTIVADGGTLNSQAITGVAGPQGALGTIQSNAGGTLNLAGAAGGSTAAFLTNNGNLALGANNVLVTTDYQNANFGSGNAFNAHADVTGSGLILAVSATQTLSGAGLSGNTLNVGNVRLGGTSSTTLTITNNGTATTLRGAVESAPTNTVSVSSSNFVVAANGGSTNVTLSYTGTTAGSLAGQSIVVANNFDNVADQTLNLSGAAYNAASASIAPNPVNLGATRVGGTLAGNVTITNTAPVSAYSEKLAVTSATGADGASSTSTPGLINPGASATAGVALSTATAGTLSGTVTYGLATDGTGTSGLAQAALASQTVTVNGKVYAVAVAQLATTNVNFGAVRAGSAAPTASVAVTNAATGALTDSLNTSIASLPANVTGSAPGALGSGQSGNLTFAENTATAGVYSGNGTIGFTSTDPDLAPLTLASQQIAFSGTVTQIAIANLFKASGAGTLTGSGTSYLLDLGTIMSGVGSTTTDFGILNNIANMSFDETLGGMFSNSGGTGYTFTGMSFANLSGGSSDTGNFLNFNYSGLGDGTYVDTLTFNGYSHYAGLSDLTLAPITINIRAQVTGAVTPPTPSVPEPATWSMMVLGFGLVGFGIRRAKRQKGGLAFAR